MNCETKVEAEKIVDEVFGLINEDYLYNRINKPIEEAASSFEFDRETPISHSAFACVTCDFVKLIYEKGFGIRQLMSDSQAHSKAVSILEKGYQNLNAKGYYAAFLDAVNPEISGFDVVLTQMAEIITTMTRTKYIRWVYTTRIENLSWATRLLIVEILLERWQTFLPSSILECSPVQMAGHLPELMSILHVTDEAAQNLMGFYNDYSE